MINTKIKSQISTKKQAKKLINKQDGKWVGGSQTYNIIGSLVGYNLDTISMPSKSSHFAF